MEDERVSRLSPSGRALLRLLTGIIEQLLSGECSEDDICDTMSRFSPDRNGFKREDDYVTVDEGMRILHMGKNRNTFCELMRKNGIRNETFNKVKIGYNRHKIEALKHRMESVPHGNREHDADKRGLHYNDRCTSQCLDNSAV